MFTVAPPILEKRATMAQVRSPDLQGPFGYSCLYVTEAEISEEELYTYTVQMVI
jgi:hypothetical protein